MAFKSEWWADTIRSKAYPLKTGPTLPECLYLSCWREWEQWGHPLSLSARGNSARHQLMKLFCFGPLHQWAERRSFAESKYFHRHKDGPVSSKVRKRLMWRTKQTLSWDLQKKKCAQPAAETQTHIRDYSRIVGCKNQPSLSTDNIK